MSRYTLYIHAESDYLVNKLINNAKDYQLIYKYGVVTGILPSKDSGLDLFFPRDETIKPGETKLIGMGIKCKMTEIDTGINVGYYTYPRSSIYKTPLRLANSTGIIDSGYRGEIKSPLTNTPDIYNFTKDFNGGFDTMYDYSYEIKKGARLIQICAPDLSPFSVSFVDSLDETERGEGGFGSTGI